MNRRARLRAQAARATARTQPSVAVDPPPLPETAAASTLPFDLLIAVMKLVQKYDAPPGAILVKNEADVLIIATGEAAAALRANRNPIALIVPERAAVAPLNVAPVRFGAEARSVAQSQSRGNAGRFISSSKLPLDSEPEPEEQPNVVAMQDDGMPRAPRDRTRAARAALIVNDKEGNPAHHLDLEAIAKA